MHQENRWVFMGHKLWLFQSKVWHEDDHFDQRTGFFVRGFNVVSGLVIRNGHLRVGGYGIGLDQRIAKISEWPISNWMAMFWISPFADLDFFMMVTGHGSKLSLDWPFAYFGHSLVRRLRHRSESIRWIFFKWRSVLYFFLKTGKRYRSNSFFIVIYGKLVMSDDIMMT